MLPKKQKKEFGYRCKSYMKKNKEFLVSLSPLQGFFNGEWDWIDADEEFFCDNARYKELVGKYRGKGFYQKDFEEVLTRIINTDEEIEKGNIEYLGERRDAISNFNLLIGCINNRRKVDLIHNICTRSGLSENTIFLIKMAAYGTIEKYDDESEKLTRICIGDNKTDVIYSSSAEEDILLEDMSIDGDVNNTLTIMRFELDIIREKMSKGESIKLYRGFAINSDERVRQGYKKDGEKYFKQSAGTGISYSLNRDVAGYFAMRSIMMKDGSFIEGGNFYSGCYGHQMQTPQLQNLISREGYIKARAKDISDMRDERKLKPIICEYLLEPEKMRGYFLNLGESEVMTLPDDIKVVHYEIATSKEIAKCQYEWINKGSNVLTAISGGLVEDGIVCWVSVEKYGKLYAIFAPANEIKEDAEKFVKAYFYGDKKERTEAQISFQNKMEKYALQLPEGLAPTNTLLSNRLYEYLRKPFNMVKEAGRKYRIGTYKG